jgi:MFS family permease
VLVFGVSLFGAMFVLPLYYQVVRGQSALDAGLLLAPQGLGAATAMPIAGRLTDTRGAGRIVPFGVVIAVIGTFAYTQLTADTSFALLAVSLYVRGVGLGMTMMPAMAAAYQTLDRAAVPRATSSINITRTVGGSLGTAILSVVLERQIAAQLSAVGSADFGTGSLGRLSGGHLPPAYADLLARAFANTLWWAVGLTALGIIPALFLPRHPVKSRRVPEASPEAA